MQSDVQRDLSISVAVSEALVCSSKPPFGTGGRARAPHGRVHQLNRQTESEVADGETKPARLMDGEAKYRERERGEKAGGTTEEREKHEEGDRE